jgi:hypothetical protein
VSDQKTNPDHYQLPNGFQVIDLTSQLDFCSGNVVKYVARAGKKTGESCLDDLLKARWYLNKLIDSEELERKLNEAGPKNETGSVVDNVHLCPPSLHCDGGWID